MQSFLETLAKHLSGIPGPELGEMQIILPNRRAGLFLQRHMVNHNDIVRWAPKIAAINDFVDETSNLELGDPFELLFTLYDVYCGCVSNPDTFDEFYYWGEIMIRDFDEMDKYLVDSEMLFSNIIDLKELEEPLAGFTDHQITFLRQFWTGFHYGDPTPEKEEFIKIWELLPVLYRGFNEALRQAGQAYPGMQYREISLRIEQNRLERPGNGRTVVAGFNALNSCEKRIFKWLNDQGAEFFWDYDHYYTDNMTQEAGRFQRNNLEQFPEQIKLESFRNLENPGQIRIFELPTDILQAKTVNRIIREENYGPTSDFTDTAIVLCDEELLMPTIMSLPGSVGEINITMGYPMKNTQVYSFVDQLLHMQSNIRTNSMGVVQYYHKDVTSLLLHPYLRIEDPDLVQTLREEISANNLIYLEQSMFEGDLGERIFRRVESAEDMITYLRSVFTHMLDNLSPEETGVIHALDREFIFQLLIFLNRLETLIGARPGITLTVLVRVFRKLLTGLKIPFEGEPISGMQVMGILETRLLDFRHVILLSMNEDVMPGTHTGQSYIPYALRIGFGMPAREDKDAIYAYYFYRLIQRAEKIDLIYNSRSEGVRTGEMSRYLYQLIYRHRIPVIRPGMEVVARESYPILVEHTPAVDEKLAKYLVGRGGGRYLSPSAINTYIDCSLKFYLRYIAGIGEPDEVAEEIDAAGFGTVVHEAIRILYSEIAVRNQDLISKFDLEVLSNSELPGRILKDAFLKHHFRGRKRGSLEGRNIIIYRVMSKYLNKIIEIDKCIAPFSLVSAEDTYQRILEVKSGKKLLNIRLGGKIDRVDQVEGKVRVIDYKTGNARTNFSDIDALFDGSSNSRNGAAFQTLLYAWFVAHKHPEWQIIPGLYIMKELYGGEFDPALTIGKYRNRMRIESFKDVEDEYISKLGETLSRIFDPVSSFVQTDNELKCRNCDFAGICNRTSIE